MKSIKFVFFIFFLPFTINAQSYFGVKGGAHLSKLKIEDSSVKLSSRLGVSFGIYAEIPIIKRFVIQPEISYISKGTTVKEDNVSLIEEVDLIYNYIDFHLLSKYNFAINELNASIIIGPTFGYLINSYVNGGLTKRKVDVSNKGIFNRPEFGINIGGGIVFPIGPVDITSEIRYLIGLTKMNGNYSDQKHKNRGVGIQFGIRFPITSSKKDSI